MQVKPRLVVLLVLAAALVLSGCGRQYSQYEPKVNDALNQADHALTGTVEGGGAFGGGGDTPIAIEDGKVDGANISFRAANVAYTGTLKGDAIELQRTGGGFPGGRGGRGAPAEPAGPRPAIGPPPDGTDPSRSVGGGAVRKRPRRWFFTGRSGSPVSPLCCVFHRCEAQVSGRRRNLRGPVLGKRVLVP